MRTRWLRLLMLGDSMLLILNLLAAFLLFIFNYDPTYGPALENFKRNYMGILLIIAAVSCLGLAIWIILRPVPTATTPLTPDPTELNRLTGIGLAGGGFIFAVLAWVILWYIPLPLDWTLLFYTVIFLGVKAGLLYGLAVIRRSI